jgi:hypothetical protein
MAEGLESEGLESEGLEAADAQVVAWPPGLRWVAALLVAGAGASVAQLGARVLLDALDGGSRTTPRVVVLGVLLGVLLPLGAVALLRQLFRARLLERPGHLRLASRVAPLELADARLAQARPWLLPLPAPGEWWELAGGALLPRALEGGARAGQDALAGRAARAAHAFAAARAALHRRGPAALALKYGLFPLLPAGVLVHVYQRITWGAWNGEYQLFGLGAWLRSTLLQWSATLAYLVVIAGTLRVAAELFCLAAAWAAPGSARGVRRGAEWGCRLLYYGGIPALLALRFLA